METIFAKCAIVMIFAVVVSIPTIVSSLFGEWWSAVAIVLETVLFSVFIFHILTPDEDE